MKNFVFGMLLLLAQPMCAQQLKWWQKEFCIETLKGYTNVNDCLKNERLQLLTLVSKHWGAQKGAEQWFVNNISRTDSLINVCVEMVENSECEKLAQLLEKERWRLYAHPCNSVSLCWDLHSVLALMYSVTIEDDREFYSAIMPLCEYSKVYVEAVLGGNDKQHPLYKQILEELLAIYDYLGEKEKTKEIATLYNGIYKVYDEEN